MNLKLFLTIFLGVALAGCNTIGHKQFYQQVAPKKFDATEDVKVFTYNNVDLSEIYELIFSDYIIVGKSAFNGPVQDAELSVPFAKSIGADIILASFQFAETRTSFMNLSTPTTSTTYINGYNGSGSVYGTATTYGTSTTTIPIRVNRYDQDAIFLHRISDNKTLWERTAKDYDVTGQNKLSGTWENENYRVRLVESGDQMVAFIDEVLDGDKSWSKAELKMLFGVQSGVGIYLMGNKTPQPSEFKVNKFGYLEVNLLSGDSTFSFMKIE